MNLNIICYLKNEDVVGDRRNLRYFHPKAVILRSDPDDLGVLFNRIGERHKRFHKVLTNTCPTVALSAWSRKVSNCFLRYNYYSAFDNCTLGPVV